VRINDYAQNSGKYKNEPVSHNVT